MTDPRGSLGRSWCRAAGRLVRRSPSHHGGRSQLLLYAFESSERAKVSIRSLEETPIAATEGGVVSEMARCLGGRAIRVVTAAHSYAASGPARRSPRQA